MPSVIGECKSYKTKRLLVVTCLTGLVLICTACNFSHSHEIATLFSYSNTYFAIIANLDPITGHTTYSVGVELKPTDIAQPNTIYKVDLYEQGQFRATTTISWNQLELNVLEIKYVGFPASYDEYHTYWAHNIDHLFSVEVHE